MQEDVRSAVPRTVTPGSRRSSRSHELLRREVDEGVVQGASSHVKTLPKNLIARYTMQDLQRAEVPLSLELCAQC